MSTSSKKLASIRSDTNKKAAERLDSFRRAWGMSIRELAKLAKVKESSLRQFFNQRHKRGPYETTLKPVLALNLPSDVEEALLDVIEFQTRVLKRALR